MSLHPPAMLSKTCGSLIHWRSNVRIVDMGRDHFTVPFHTNWGLVWNEQRLNIQDQSTRYDVRIFHFWTNMQLKAYPILWTMTRWNFIQNSYFTKQWKEWIELEDWRCVLATKHVVLTNKKWDKVFNYFAVVFGSIGNIVYLQSLIINFDVSSKLNFVH